VFRRTLILTPGVIPKEASRDLQLSPHRMDVTVTSPVALVRGNSLPGPLSPVGGGAVTRYLLKGPGNGILVLLC